MMKKFLLACSLIGVISAVNAQTAQPASTDNSVASQMMMREHAFDPAKHAAELQKRLQLSDDQAAKAKKLFEDAAQQRKALEDKYKPQLEAFHADMKKLHEQTDAQLKGILTPKQQQALEAQQKAHGDGMCRGDKGDGSMHGYMHGDKMPTQ